MRLRSLVKSQRFRHGAVLLEKVAKRADVFLGLIGFEGNQLYVCYGFSCASFCQNLMLLHAGIVVQR